MCCMARSAGMSIISSELEESRLSHGLTVTGKGLQVTQDRASINVAHAVNRTRMQESAWCDRGNLKGLAGQKAQHNLSIASHMELTESRKTNWNAASALEDPAHHYC